MSNEVGTPHPPVHGLAFPRSLRMETAHNFCPETLAWASVSLIALRSSLRVRNYVYSEAGLNHETNHVILVEVCGVDFANL